MFQFSSDNSKISCCLAVRFRNLKVYHDGLGIFREFFKYPMLDLLLAFSINWYFVKEVMIEVLPSQGEGSTDLCLAAQTFDYNQHSVQLTFDQQVPSH